MSVKPLLTMEISGSQTASRIDQGENQAPAILESDLSVIPIADTSSVSIRDIDGAPSDATEGLNAEHARVEMTDVHDAVSAAGQEPATSDITTAGAGIADDAAPPQYAPRQHYPYPPPPPPAYTPTNDVEGHLAGVDGQPQEPCSSSVSHRVLTFLALSTAIILLITSAVNASQK